MENKIDEKQMRILRENVYQYNIAHTGFERLKIVEEKTDDGIDIWLFKTCNLSNEKKKYHLGQLK